MRERVGLRGVALIALAVLDLVYAYGLLYPPQPVTSIYLFPSDVIDLCWWALLWAGVGVILLLFAFRLNDTPGYVVAVLIKAFWGLFLGIGWAGGDVVRGYVSATIFLVFAAVVLVVMVGVPQPALMPERGDA